MPFGATLLMNLYSAVGRMLTPFAGLVLRRRARRGKEDGARRPERLGRASEPRPDGPLVCVHAASVGETLCVLPLIERIRERGVGVLLTTGTVTAARLACERLPEGALHQYQPVDLPGPVRRFLDHWRPDLAITVESEIWPLAIRSLARRGIPHVLVNARMSDRSTRRWAKRPNFARNLFGGIDTVLAQSEIDAERFRYLGARTAIAVGNLKFDRPLPECDEKELCDLRSAIIGRPRWVCVSTHEDEEAVIAECAALVTQGAPDAVTLVLPRHPELAARFRATFEKLGLRVAQRSRAEPIEPSTQVYLADTLGEAGLFLRLADIAFLGRSLGVSETATGGQNPIEAIGCGCAVLSGTHVGNFRETYAALFRAAGAKAVEDERMLAACVVHLMKHDENRATLLANGLATVDSMKGALDRTLAVLDRHLDPLRIDARLSVLTQRGHGQIGAQTFDRLREAAGQGATRTKLARRLSETRPSSVSKRPDRVSLAGE